MPSDTQSQGVGCACEYWYGHISDGRRRLTFHEWKISWANNEGWNSLPTYDGASTSTCELWCSRPLAPANVESTISRIVYSDHGASPNTAASGGITRLSCSHAVARVCSATAPAG